MHGRIGVLGDLTVYRAIVNQLVADGVPFFATQIFGIASRSSPADTVVQLSSNGRSIFHKRASVTALP